MGAYLIAHDTVESCDEISILFGQSYDLYENAADNLFSVSEQGLLVAYLGIAAFDSVWQRMHCDFGTVICAAIAAVLSVISIANLNIKSLKQRKFAAGNLSRIRTIFEELVTRKLARLKQESPFLKNNST